MKSLAKICFALMNIIGVLGGTYGIYKMVAGNFAMNDPFAFGFILMAYIMLVAGAYVATKRFWTENIKESRIYKNSRENGK